MTTFNSYVPKRSIKLLECWINELHLEVKVTKPRKSKLGDFKVIGDQLIISINNNLNKYAFLITLVHEIAHAFVFKKYQNTVLPHSRSWKLTYKALMLNFLTTDYFPDDILKVLCKHMIYPSASSYSDISLVKVLRKYDSLKKDTLSDLNIGDIFRISSGKEFVKGKKIRKRYKCIECSTNKVYLFHPFADVTKFND
ncbi:sprT domain-containing protein [Flavobacteriales bacterium]|jgi:SprT protein|nr:sprT domain-containing protein [Flavobacteriales bacterium]MDA7577851.1 sprT domain-containing protein [Flavobacteriales bacterium]